MVIFFVDKSFQNIVLSPNSKFERRDALENRVCENDDRVFTSSLISDVKCALRCMLSEECMSIFNEAGGGKCYGCRTVYSQTSPELLQEMPGNLHYQIYPGMYTMSLYIFLSYYSFIYLYCKETHYIFLNGI